MRKQLPTERTVVHWRAAMVATAILLEALRSRKKHSPFSATTPQVQLQGTFDTRQRDHGLNAKYPGQDQKGNVAATTDRAMQKGVKKNSNRRPSTSKKGEREGGEDASGERHSKAGEGREMRDASKLRESCAAPAVGSAFTPAVRPSALAWPITEASATLWLQ